MAISPAHNGATALVPPITMALPSTRILYPVSGDASPATSGTPRPFEDPLRFACQLGCGNTVLKPPPVAPPCGWSFQTTSLEIVDPLPARRVPPQASTCGLEAGKSTWFLPSLTPSEDPLSPDATVMVTPSAAADWQ